MASLERTNAQESSPTSKKQTHEEEYIKVLEVDISTNEPPEQTVKMGSAAEIDKHRDREANSSGEYGASQMNSQTITESDNSDSQLIKKTNGYEIEQTNTKVTEHKDTTFGRHANQTTNEQTTECNSTNTDSIMSKQIYTQNTTSPQEQAELNNTSITNTFNEEPMTGFMDNGSAEMVDTLQGAPTDSQIKENRVEVTTALKHNEDHPYDKGDKDDKIKQASSQNAESHLDITEVKKVHETEHNGKDVLCDIKPKQTFISNIADKTIKPPLPPKPTTCTQAVTSQLKRNNSGTMGKRNDGHHAQASAFKFSRKRKIHRLSRFDTRSSTSDSVISSTTASSEDSMVTDVQYMAEVYRDWIKYHIRVDDLLPLLPLGKYETDIIKSKQKACPPGAVEMLLDIMSMNDIPGIWQSFLDALKSLEYVHLSQLLRKETEIDHSNSSNILKLVTHDLKQRICMPEFLDAVYERGLLVPSEHEEADTVYRARGSQAAAGVIIEGVDKHLPNWDEVFSDVLEKSGMADIAELFKPNEQLPPCCLQEHFTEIPKDKKGIKQQKLHQRRIEYWKRTAELQSTSSDAGFDVRTKMTAGNKFIDINALCITVTQIQSDVKLLTRGMEEMKVMQSEILKVHKAFRRA